LVPSLTEITMLELVPTLAACGVPESCPVLALKLVQAGLLAIEKVSGLPLGSVVVGVNPYAEPTVTEVGGEPLIVGGEVPPPELVTVIEKPGSETLLVPSLTEIMMFELVPTLAAWGVPESCPVLALKLAQPGLPAIEKVSALPLGSVVEGVKL
jgi:hypothetical protein